MPKEINRFKCIVCSKRTKAKERRFLQGKDNRRLRQFLRKTFLLEIRHDDCICNRCRMHHYNNSKRIPSHSQINEPQEHLNPEIKSPRSIRLPISSAGYTHSTCFICGQKDRKTSVVPENAIYQFFISRSIILNKGARCCSAHLNGDVFKADIGDFDIKTRDFTDFNREGVNTLLCRIRDIAQKCGEKRLDFDSPSALTNYDYHNLTGLNEEQFNNLMSFVTDLRSTKSRSIRTCVAIYLMKMRLALSNSILGTLFYMTKQQVRRSVESARKSLMGDFVKRHLGFAHVTREDVTQKHTRTLAKELFGDKVTDPAILVLDGTYIYVQKSGNFTFSRRSYSVHKHRPLVKIMMVVTTTGYIVSTLGPYLADSKNNDASILKHMVATNTEEIRDWLEEDDVLVVDRGFRDAAEVVEDLGLKMEMPSFLKRGEKQHATQDANDSRLVTKVRWVVESANGRLKSSRYLDRVLPNSQIPHIGDHVRIIAAIINAYRPPLSTGDHDDDVIMAAKMKHLATKKNELYESLEKGEFEKKTKKWTKMDGNDAASSFPRLDEEQLRDLTVGVYQIKLAKSYTKEHFDEFGTYEIYINEETENILGVKIQSRHVSSQKYFCWISYEDGSIIAWYCKCKAGKRVVGTYAHVASVMWYLGYGRYEETSSVQNFCSHVCDASKLPIDESDDEELVEE